MKNLMLLRVVGLMLWVGGKTYAQNPVEYVNPLIGSGGHGHVFVGASVPFGAVQLGPVNIFEGWDWCSGYHHSSNTIVGFAHTHLSGTGIGDLNDILLMPQTGELSLVKETKSGDGYLSTFSHSNEVVRPGYYKVFLEKYKIQAELTASERVGYHRYTFTGDVSDKHIIIDLGEGIGWDSPTETFLKRVDDRTFFGYRMSTGWASDQREYFAIQFSAPASVQYYDSISLLHTDAAKGKHVKAIVNFEGNRSSVIEVKVGLSPVSAENALLNIKTEIPNWNFVEVVSRAEEKWNTELSRVSISASDSVKQIFYTALYHTMISPSLFNDVNGDYRGSDKGRTVHHGMFTNYTVFSLWDTYRAYHPLFTILHPEKVADIINTFLAIYKEQGKLPVWHLKGCETNTMVGYHAIPVIVDAYLKGFRGFDEQLAYEAIRHSAMQHVDGIQFVQQQNFIPADSLVESVARGLEYAIDDWCVAQMAKALHKEADYQYFSKRAKLYQLYFDSQQGFMRGRLADGSWRTPFDPIKSIHRGDEYTEGNAWQYTWLVPHDVKGLISLFKSEERFVSKLDSLFLVEGSLGEASSPDITGLIGQYAHGNEPGHHTAYLYAFVDQPWKTAERVRHICNTFYTRHPDGLCGNEDAGQMSAWYIFSALGFYPVNPANGQYVFGSPLVDKAVITIRNKAFTIEVVNNSSENKYIQRVYLNGKQYSRAFLTHDDLTAGGTLKIVMGKKPSKRWGVGEKNIPD